MAESIVTRFAPSPTGALHVGGARTALFNWAFARGRGGRFLLRIEDTDQARSSEAAEKGVLEDLKWLGMDWDNHGQEPRQSRRLDLYNAAVQKLRDAGCAYDDDGAVRFRMPEQDITVHDEVLGDVTVAAGQNQDFVIQKSDGFPTYHLAVVVDDAEMSVTHVIRGQEHLNNAPKHWVLQEALAIPHPTYAHIPLIFNADGSKMSKRDKAKAARKAAKDAGIDDPTFADFLGKKNDDPLLAIQLADRLGVALPEIEVSDFRASGYLPEVLCNYLALLGWNPGEDREKFDLPFLAERFDLDRVGRSNARFDRDKLFRFNADAIAAMDPLAFADRWRTYCQAFGPRVMCELEAAAFGKLAAAYQARSRTLKEPGELASFFLVADEQVEYDEHAIKKVLLKNEEQGFDVLDGLKDCLAEVDPWTGESAHAVIHAFAEGRELGLGKVAQPLRVAVSGGTVSPPIDQTLEILGKAATIARIDRCLKLRRY